MMSSVSMVCFCLRPMYLREDGDVGETSVKEVMSNAKLTMANFFVAPGKLTAADCLADRNHTKQPVTRSFSLSPWLNF